jgi:hypothetical protein
VSDPSPGPASGDLVPYTHPGGLRLLVPARWELSEDPRPGLLLVAVEPEINARMGGGFRANLVVTCEQLSADLDLDTWQATTGQMLPSTLDDYVPVSVGGCDLGGMPAVHRVAQHRTKGGSNVTMEQWAAVLPEVGTDAGPGSATGWSLTASVATRAHPRRAAMLTEVAESWRPPGHGAVGSEPDPG